MSDAASDLSQASSRKFANVSNMVVFRSVPQGYDHHGEVLGARSRIVSGRPASSRSLCGFCKINVMSDAHSLHEAYPIAKRHDAADMSGG